MTKRTPDPDAVHQLHARLRVDAALREGFDPVKALAHLPGGLPEDDLVIAAALSALREDSSVTRDEDGQVWTLRPAVRRKVLEQLPESELIGRDSALVQALTGSVGYQPDAIRRLVRYAEGPRPPPAAVLARRLRMLERAGPRAPAHDQVLALRGALNSAERRALAAASLSGGVFGREGELARLAAWIEKPQYKAPVRSLHVSGLPGVGKSFLLQAAVQVAAAGEKGALTIWLDFDRSGLAVTDATVFFEEVSRQIGDALPSSAAELRNLRLQAARERSALAEREADYALPRNLLAEMGRIVAGQPRPVLVVMDTLEVMRARGETAVERLFENLDTLLSAGVSPMTLISAGRGDALDPVPDRRAAEIRLLGLPDTVADSYLASRGVVTEARAELLRLAKGNPLLLQLSARAYADGLSLPETAGEGAQSAGAYLYRAILSRLDPPLNALAQAGLVLQRIHPTHLRSILAPALDLAPTAAQSEALFHELATQHWLVEGDSSGGWLRHRADIRAAFLPLLYADQPELAARVNARAAEVLASTDPSAALYHRLQLTRGGAAVPDVNPLAAAQFGATMIDELPPAAQDALRRARGERSRNFRAGARLELKSLEAPLYSPAIELEAFGAPDPYDVSASASAEGIGFSAGLPDVLVTRADSQPGGIELGSRIPHMMVSRVPTFSYDSAKGTLTKEAAAIPRPIDPRLTGDLRLMITGGDRREARHLVDAALSTPFRAGDPGAVVVLAYLWVSGTWDSALRLWRAMGAPYDDPDPTLARLLREVDAEARFVKARGRLPNLPSPVASGRSALLGSAYDVALATRGKLDSSPSDGRMRAEALLAPWMPKINASATARLRSEAEVRRERVAVTLATSVPELLLPGVTVAAMIPHLVPLTALATDRSGEARAAWLANLAPRLPEILELQAPWIDLPPSALVRAAETPFEMLDLLAGCGLLTEAATAMALTLRDGETARLALSAERWRRLSHGLWSYSKHPPHGWQGRADLDAMTQHLLTMRPKHAERLAHLWLLEPEAQARLAYRLKGRMPRGYPEERAIAALRCDLPPGLAVAAALFPKGFYD